MRTRTYRLIMTLGVAFLANGKLPAGAQAQDAAGCPVELQTATQVAVVDVAHVARHAAEITLYERSATTAGWHVAS